MASVSLFCHITSLFMLTAREKWSLYSALPAIPCRDIDRMDVVPTEFYGNMAEIERWMDTYAVAVLLKSEHTTKKRANFLWAPYVCYTMGDPAVLDREGLGIVGPRLPSRYAERVVREVFDYAPLYVLRTVSWGAPGIDMQAHTLSLEKHVPTVMVIGAGLRRYMQDISRRKIVERIVEEWGLIYSAFRLDQAPARYTFPQRNRYIAWLSSCLFVPEASISSGSLITVDFAVRMRTPCYGVPQHIYAPESAGLLQARAQKKIELITDVRILFQHFVRREETPSSLPASLLSRTTVTQNISPPISPESSLVWDILQKHGILSVDVLLSYTKKDPPELLSILVQGELAGRWEEIGPGLYQNRHGA